MIENADNFASPAQGRPKTRFEVRSVTGACYTLVEEADRDGADFEAGRGSALRRTRVGVGVVDQGKEGHARDVPSASVGNRRAPRLARVIDRGDGPVTGTGFAPTTT